MEEVEEVVEEEKEFKNTTDVKEEMEEVMEVEIADPLGLDDEESRLVNEANGSNPATLGETVIEARGVEIQENRKQVEEDKVDTASVYVIEPDICSNEPIRPLVDPKLDKSQAKGGRQIVISLEQSQASREVVVEEEEQVVREERAEGIDKVKVDEGMRDQTKYLEPDKKKKEQIIGEDLKNNSTVKRTSTAHRFNKIKTKEIAKYNINATLEKSISKKHSLSLSLRKAVLEKLEKQKELLALREAQKRKSEAKKVVDVVDTDLVEVPRKIATEIRIEDESVSDQQTNTKSDAVDVVAKASVEPKVDLKSLIKSLVTTKTPDSETIKKIVSKTRLDLRNQEEMGGNEKRKKAEMEKENSKAEGGDVKRKCRYCKDNEGWGEVIGCDFCSSFFHPGCLNLGPPELKLVLALSHWKCPECIKGSKEVSSSTKDTSLQGEENISLVQNLKRRAEMVRVEVKVARMKLNMGQERGEKEGVWKTKGAVKEKGEERPEVEEKGRDGVQEQVRRKTW